MQTHFYVRERPPKIDIQTGEIERTERKSVGVPESEKKGMAAIS